MKILKMSGVLLLCILFASCEKRKYPEENVQLQKEDIYVACTVDGEPVNLKIGTDGYYCYSSYNQRADSIYVFTGELRKYDCHPCSNALQIELSDYKARGPGESVEADVSLGNGSRRFIPGLEKLRTIKFVAHSNKDVASVNREVSNGFTSESAEMECDFGQAGPQTVSLTVLTKNNCESRVVNKIYIYANGYFACDVKSTLIQGKTSNFSAGIQGGKPPYRFEWDFGDGVKGTEESPTHSYQYIGSYPVKVKVWDADNHLCEANYTHIAGNDQSSCAANMTLTYKETQNAFLNCVKIQWKDQANTVLRSDSVAQPAGSYFEIIGSAPYAANERNESGRLLTVRCNVLLAGNNRKVWFKTENTAIAVTYK